MRTNDRAAWAHAAARALSRSGRRMLSLTLSLVLALTLLPGMALAAEGDVAINETNFPDANFQKYIKDVLDTNEPKGVLDADEIAAVTELTFEYPDRPGVKMSNIASLKGIEYFTALTTLDCSEQKLTTMDVSKNTKLTKLDCSENQITSLDLSENTALTDLDCDYNQLETLDVSKNLALTELACYNNRLTALNVGANTVLKELVCSYNQLESLDVRANTALTTLTCDNNQLMALILSQNTALMTLACDSNQLTSLDVTANKALTKLFCDSNQLRTLDLRQNTELTSLTCGSNQLTNLDLSKNTKLTFFRCTGNQYTLGLKDGDNTFELSELTKFGFDVTKASNWRNGTIKGTTLTVNEGAETVLYNYSCGNGHTADFQLKVHADPVRAIELSSTGTVAFDDLEVGYSTVAEKRFIIRNTGNMSTGELKVVLEGKDANAFQFEIKDVTLTKDGNISNIEVGGTVPTVIYKPKAGLKAGAYTVKVIVKSADENSTMSPASFNISLTVKSNGTESANSGYAFQVTAPTEMTVGQDCTNASVRLYANEVRELGYEKVLIKIAVAGPAGGTATIKAKDTAGAEWDMAKIGFWGPSAGFPVAANYDAMTPLTHLSFDKAGTYTATFTLVDLNNNDAVLATGTHTVTVRSESTTTTPATPTQPATPKLPFTDVSEDDWFYADAAYLYEKGVMKGTADETFAPGRSVTRGQLAAALYRMAGEPAVTAKAAFTDVPADYWCAAAITWAAENGVVTGYGDGGFRPADAVQRQELSAMLFRFAVYQGMSAVTLEENLAPFADRADVAAYAVPAMNWAVGQGILQGKDGSLLPQAPVDRAQLAAMLRRYLEK